MSDDNGFDVPVSEPLPEGLELTEVANGEKSELMERALEDKAQADANPDDLDLGPQPIEVWEVPDHELRSGHILKHDGSNESAIRISLWLSENGVTSFMVPRFSQFPAMIRIDNLMDIKTVAEEDYVFLSNDNKVYVFTQYEARKRFRIQGDSTPLGRISTAL